VKSSTSILEFNVAKQEFFTFDFDFFVFFFSSLILINISYKFGNIGGFDLVADFINAQQRFSCKYFLLTDCDSFKRILKPW
jgi:hypothetical protein